MTKRTTGPVTFDGALPPPPNQKADLDEKKRALMQQLKELEAKYGKS